MISEHVRIAGLFGGLIVVAAFLCGCQGETIDERISRVVGDSSLRLGDETVAPHPLFGPGTGVEGSYDRSPETTNPESSELTFKPADEAREVGAKLDTYAKDAASGGVPAQTTAIRLGLAESLRIAQQYGRDFRTQEEDYVITAIQLLIEQHRWGPRLTDEVVASVGGDGDDGRFDSAVRVVNQLRATQRLPYGGEAEARWVWDATEQLREQATERYVQTSLIGFDVRVPLLRGAGMIAQEELIQAERNLVYAARSFERFRRENLVDVANEYFDLLDTRLQIGNRERSLENLRLFADQTRALVEAGRRRQFDLNDAETQVLSAESNLAQQRERYILQLDRFKLRIGLPIDAAAEVAPLGLELIEPQVDPEQAASIALEYRLDLQNTRDSIEDSRRTVANARNALLPDLDISAGADIPTDSDTREGGVEFDFDDTIYNAGVTLGLPLDREEERLRVRQAVIALNRAERNYDRQRDDIVVVVRAALRTLDLARFELNLAERGVELSARRIEEFNLNPAQFNTRQRLEAQEDLVSAENGRDNARTVLRKAILSYLLATDQIRVARDGMLLMIPGMDKGLEPVVPPPVAPNT